MASFQFAAASAVNAGGWLWFAKRTTAAAAVGVKGIATFQGFGSLGEPVTQGGAPLRVAWAGLPPIAALAADQSGAVFGGEW
jgi:hypothetical protein